MKARIIKPGKAMRRWKTVLMNERGESFEKIIYAYSEEAMLRRVKYSCEWEKLSVSEITEL